MSEIIQGSADWKALRLGKATASRIADVVAKTKSGWGASRANYMAELVAERLTSNAAEGFTSPAMQWGIEKEPDAIAAYEFLTGAEIERVAFDPHPTIAMAGASPDGLVGDKGMIEVKCPNTATHLATLLGAPIPEKYIIQTSWQMACRPEREWCDWCSFDPRVPDEMRLYVYRIKRDNARIANLEKEVVFFLAEVERQVAELSARYLGGASPTLAALRESVEAA
jgi:hypothetical protein